MSLRSTNDNDHHIYNLPFNNGMIGLTLIVFEMKSVGKNYYGTAPGLMNSIGMLGPFVAPPIGNSLTAINPGAPLIFWGLLTAAAIPFFLIIKDRG